MGMSETAITAYQKSLLPPWVVALIVVGMLALVIFIVFISNAERRLPVQYAKRVVGRKMYGGQSTHIPMKVNMSGVMPIIFAQSIASLPATIGAFTGHTMDSPGNVNFCFEGIEGESLLLLLDDKGICASSGSACTSGSLDPSHVLLAIGRPHEVAHGSLRLSLGEDMTEADIDEIILAVTDVVNYLRNISPFWRDLVNGKRPHIFER